MVRFEKKLRITFIVLQFENDTADTKSTHTHIIHDMQMSCR